MGAEVVFTRQRRFGSTVWSWATVQTKCAAAVPTCRKIPEIFARSDSGHATSIVGKAAGFAFRKERIDHMGVKKPSLFGPILIAIALLIGFGAATHIGWRTKQYAVSEDGRISKDAKVYRYWNSLYLTLPKPANEAYVIDRSNRAVLVPYAGQFSSMGPCLLAQRWIPRVMGYEKLRRGFPEFDQDSVTFISNNGALISVRWH